MVDGLAASGDWWKAADLFSFTINGIPSSRRLTKNTLKIYKFIEDIFLPDAFEYVHKELEALRSEFTAWEAVTRSTNFGQNA